MNTGLTHDWAYGDFMPSQIVEAIGLAIGVTGIVTFTVANITPPQAAAIAATLQIARLMGTEVGNAFIQTFVRVDEQFQSNQIGLHLAAGSDIVQNMIAQISGHFSDTASSGDATSQAIETIGVLTQKEAYVLAYIDAFWIVAWVLALSLLLILVLRPPPPNPLTPPRKIVV
jgi:DHA2 family multidrug resistance protein